MAKFEFKVSGITGGGQGAPKTFDSGNFCWPTREREARKKSENGRRKEGKVKKWGEGPFFFAFGLFKTTEKLKNVLRTYQNWNVSTGKRHFTFRETTEISFGSTKIEICPLRKSISCYAPVQGNGTLGATGCICLWTNAPSCEPLRKVYLY